MKWPTCESTPASAQRRIQSVLDRRERGAAASSAVLNCYRPLRPSALMVGLSGEEQVRILWEVGGPEAAKTRIKPCSKVANWRALSEIHK